MKQNDMPIRRIPVILDTDIGGDIDDTWALAMLLNSPELDLKLVVTAAGDTLYRAKVAAKMLEAACRTDVPVGIGINTSGLFDHELKPQVAWVNDYHLEDYPGPVHQDGVDALIDTIMNSDEQVILIVIGPVTNIGEALRRKPEIAMKARFVGMHGNVRSFFLNEDKVIPEYNVKCDIAACRAAFTAPWDITITPLDTCGKVVLRGENYARVSCSENKLARAVMENYKLWLEYLSDRKDPSLFERESSILFDTVAVYLAISEEYLGMETLGIRVLDDGLTLIDDNAKKMHCALKWLDIGAFEDFLVRRVTGEV